MFPWGGLQLHSESDLDKEANENDWMNAVFQLMDKGLAQESSSGSLVVTA